MDTAYHGLAPFARPSALSCRAAPPFRQDIAMRLIEQRSAPPWVHAVQTKNRSSPGGAAPVFIGVSLKVPGNISKITVYR